MKKIFMIIMMFLLLTSFISAETVTSNDLDISFDNNGFGEKNTFFTRAIDFINSVFKPKEFSFVSTETPLFEGNYYYGGEKTLFTFSATACDKCAIGNYCEIQYADTRDRIFADLWYKSYSADIINLADPKYFTSKESFIYGYTCWEVLLEPEVPEYIYSCRDGNIYLDGAKILSCGVDERCDLSDGVYIIKQTNTYLLNNFCEKKDLCYQCDGGRLVSDYQDGCDPGWSTRKPTCVTEPVINKINCYRCSNGQVISKQFTDTCDAGWSKTAPTSCTNTCYQCSNGVLLAEQFATICPTGWVSIVPSSCAIPQVSCYTCNDGVLISELNVECVTPWSSTPVDCSRNEETDWLKDNAPDSYIIIGIVVILLLIVAYYITKPRGKKR